MVSAIAWLAFPLVLLAVATGVGVLAERAAGQPLPPGLLAPLGACLGLVGVLPVFKLGGGALVAGVLLALAGACGLVLSRAELRPRLAAGWPALAGAAVYVLYLAPVLFSGHWTWAGYNFVNDTSVNMVMVDHVARHGVELATGASSTTTAIVNGTLSTSYPMGMHGLLAALNALVPLPLEAVYQPFIAALGGLAAMAFATLALRIGVPGPVAAAGAVLAMAANLTYQYAQHGAFKEIGLVVVVATAAALARLALDAGLRPRLVALLGACLAAGPAIVAAAGAPYVAVLALLLLAAPWLDAAPRPTLRRVATAAAAGAAALALAGLPAAEDTLGFGRVAAAQYSGDQRDDPGSAPPTSPAELGHLVRALPASQGLGTWLRSDYRYPLAPGNARTANAALLALAAALLAWSAVVELRRRRLGVLLALVPAAAVYLAAAPRLTPYAEAKLLVVAAPAAVFAAAMGAWWAARRVPWLGAALAAGLAGGVLLSDALVFHDVRLAPTDRLEALADAVERAPADALILAPEWEEFAKYFARDRRINSSQEPYSPLPVELRRPEPVFARSFDLDDLRLAYVERFRAILLRRGPDRSRPPAGFELAHRNAYYELWLRRPGPRVLDHLPLQSMNRAQAPPPCAEVRAFAAATGPSERLVASERPPTVLFDYTRRPPPLWNPGAVPGTVVPLVPGAPRGTVRLGPGPHRVWVRGSTGRAVTVSVGGRRLPAVEGVESPRGWLEAGTVEPGAGEHEVSLLRPGGSPAPGDGYSGELGPVAFEPVGDARLVTVTAGRAAAELCGRPLDWLERVDGTL